MIVKSGPSLANRLLSTSARGCSAVARENLPRNPRSVQTVSGDHERAFCSCCCSRRRKRRGEENGKLNAKSFFISFFVFVFVFFIKASEGKRGTIGIIDLPLHPVAAGVVTVSIDLSGRKRRRRRNEETALREAKNDEKEEQLLDSRVVVVVVVVVHFFARKLSLTKLCASGHLSLSLLCGRIGLFLFAERFLCLSVLNPKSNFLFPFFFFLSGEYLFRYYIYKAVRIRGNYGACTQSSRAGESFQRETEKERARECVCVCVSVRK